MSFSHEINQAWSNGARSIPASNSFSGGGEGPGIDEVIPAEASDTEVAYSLDVSQVKAFFMLAQGDMTIKTNNAGAPDNTLELKAGIPYIWFTNSYDSFQITVDVTKLFVSDGSAAENRLQIEDVFDSTPA